MGTGIVEEFVIQILDIIEIIVFFNKILQGRLTTRKRYFMYCFLVIFLSELIYVLCPDKNIGFFTSRIGGHMIAVCIIFTGKLKSRLVKYWFCMFYIDMVNFPIEVIVNHIFQIFHLEKYIPVGKTEIISILVITVIYVIGKQIRKRKNWVLWIQSVPLYYFGWGILCSFCVAFTGSFINYIQIGENKVVYYVLEAARLIISTFIYVLGIGFVFVNIWRIEYKNQCELKDNYLMILKKYYAKMASHIQEVRSMKHDMRAHLSLLESYIKQNKWEQAERYLEELKIQQDTEKTCIIDVGNELVSAILTDYMQSADQDIEFICEGVVPKDLAITDFDLCTIFSNIISNSIESCNHIEEKRKWIHMQVKTFQGNLMIAIKNPTSEDVKIEELGKYTRKKDKSQHGYGIQNIKKAVEKYDGQIDFEVENGEFQIKIIFYHVIETACS